MIDGQNISEHEYGLVRVFVLVRPSDLARGKALAPDQIAEWIGVGALDVDHIQQMWTMDLEDIGLPEFLAAGYDVRTEDLEANRDALEATGDMHPTVYVIARSPAFLTKPAELSGEGPLHLLATLREPDTSVTFDPLPNPDGTAVLEDPPQKKVPSDAAMSGRVATVALLVMALLVVLMIWVAG